MFYRAIKTCTFVAAIVLAQQAQALDQYVMHLEEPDRQLLKLMEERCFEPEYLMSFPDGFTSREHSHACNVAAFFKPTEYQRSSRNLSMASFQDGSFNNNEARILAEYRSINNESEIMKRILNRDALLLYLTPKESMTKFDRESLNRVAGPNFFEMLVEPHILDHKYSVDGLADLTRRIVDSAYLMSDHYLQEAINNLSIAISVFQLRPDFENRYYTKHGFGLSIDHDFAKDLLVLSKLTDSTLFDQASFFNAPTGVLKIRFSSSRDILGSSRASQVNLKDSFGNSADLSIIYHLESLRRWLSGMMGFEPPLEDLSSLKLFADNGFDDLLTEYLVYFPIVSSSELLQSDLEQLIQTLATTIQNGSFARLENSEKRLMQAFITSSIYSPLSHQLWSEVYATRNLVWPFRKEMFDDVTIEWWEDHTSALVVFIAKQESYNGDFYWSEGETNKLARQISSQSESLCHGFSQNDCELLFNHVDQFRLLGGGKDPVESMKRLLKLGGLNTSEMTDSLSYEQLNRIKMCHIPEDIEGLYLRALAHGNLNSLFRTKCTKQDHLDWLEFTEPEFYPWITRSVIRRNGIEVISNSWLNATGLGLLSSHLLKYASDPRLIDTPSDYHAIGGFSTNNRFHEPYEKALGSRPMPSFDENDNHTNTDNLEGLSGFFHEIGLVERALLALIQHKPDLEESEVNFPYEKEEYQFSLRAAARQTGLPSAAATNLAYNLNIKELKTLSDQQLLEFFTMFAGNEELGRRLLVDQLTIPPTPENLDEEKVIAAIKKAENEEDYKEIWRYLLGLEEPDFQYICVKLLTEAKAKEDFLTIMSNPQFTDAMDKIRDAFGWVAARTTYCGRQIFNDAARELLGDDSSLDKGSDLLSFYLQTTEGNNFEHSKRLTSHASLERMKSFADFGSLRISVVAPVIALYGLVEITEQAKLMFLMRDSRNFRRIQLSLEQLITSLLTTFSDEEFRKVLGEEKSNQLLDLAYELQINFHEPMVSAKSRNRAVLRDSENNINNSEELTRTIKSRYKDLATANSLEDFILKLASIGENLPSVKVNLYPNNPKILDDRDQLKLLPKASGILDVMYTDGVIKGYSVTANGPSLVDYEFDPELIRMAKDEIRNTGSLSLRSMESLCAEAEKQGTYQSFAKYQTLVIVPSVNLLPIPHDLLFGSLCHNSAYQSIYASSVGAGLELLLNPTPGKVKSETIVAMGDPRPAEENNFIGFLSPNHANTRSKSIVPNIYPPLPNAANEVQSISEMFPSKTVYLGTEGSLRQTLKTAEKMAKEGRATYLLIATHGIEPSVDETAVLPSLLSSESASLELVSTAEIYGTELSGAIVSLSACQTASGLTDDPGQQLSGFPTAFADAGAKLIVASLWNVADTTSKRFSEAFFLSLKNSKSFLKATQAARKAVSPLGSAPYVFIYP